jgi:hypothetical protein
MDGSTIVENGGGAWEVSSEWLDGVIAAAVAAAPPKGILIKAAAYSGSTYTITDQGGIPDPVPDGYMITLVPDAPALGNMAAYVAPVRNLGTLQIVMRGSGSYTSNPQQRNGGDPFTLQYQARLSRWIYKDDNIVSLTSYAVREVLPVGKGGTNVSTLNPGYLLSCSDTIDDGETEVDPYVATEIKVAGSIGASPGNSEVPTSLAVADYVNSAAAAGLLIRRTTSSSDFALDAIITLDVTNPEGLPNPIPNGYTFVIFTPGTVIPAGKRLKLRVHPSGGAPGMMFPQTQNDYNTYEYSISSNLPMTVQYWVDAIGQGHYDIKPGPGVNGTNLALDRNRGVLPVSKGGTGASALAAEITAESTDLEVPTAKAVYELFKSLI